MHYIPPTTRINMSKREKRELVVEAENAISNSHRETLHLHLLPTHYIPIPSSAAKYVDWDIHFCGIGLVS
jgi:hypothetical protein